MIRSYIILAWRNMLRSKAYSLINISGLSMGVTCCLLLALYIQDEMAYDKHHKRLDDLYILTTHFENDFGFGVKQISTVGPPVTQTFKQEIPEFESAARIVKTGENLFNNDGNLFYEENGAVADSSVFNILTYTFLEGNPRHALRDANSVVLTDRLAQKIFGNEPALNKLVSISEDGYKPVNFKVTGVIKEQLKSHHQITFFTSINSEGLAKDLASEEMNNEWGGENFFHSVVKLTPDHDIESIEKKMNEVLQKHGAETFKAIGMAKSIHLYPLKDVYLKSDTNGQSPRINYLYVIASIATFILLIACINFMNLSTARASKRAMEIGIRKVMGAYRSTLMRHILAEAMVIVLFSIILSVVLVQLALPAFNYLTGKTIGFTSGNTPYFVAALFVLTIVTGLIAGSYPAFYLSSFEPAQVLKGKFNMGNSSGMLRRSLVVFQFIIAITLVSGMIIITQQLNYMQNKGLGFDDQAKIVIPMRTDEAQGRYSSLRNQIEKIPAVKAASGARFVPGTRIRNDMLFYTEGNTMDNAITNFRNRVDHGYIELLGIKMLSGRTFNENRESESDNKVIINRTSAKRLGFEPEEATGEHLYFDWQGQHHIFEIIGVMEDYHQSSVKDEIKSIMFQMPQEENEYENLIVAVEKTDFKGTIAEMEKIWRSQINNTPFEYSFLDENIQKQYDEDRRVHGIITGFTCIAVLISCLGLYGLSTYMAERRFKEIGVRKVMGASIPQIIGLMSSEFIKLVVIALVISIPIAWYAMNTWLTTFANRITIDALVFVYAGSAALIIATATISFESLRAASGNPLKALRSE